MEIGKHHTHESKQKMFKIDLIVWKLLMFQVTF